MKKTQTFLISGDSANGCRIVKRKPARARLCTSVNQLLMFLDCNEEGKFACVVTRTELKLVDAIYGVKVK